MKFESIEKCPKCGKRQSVVRDSRLVNGDIRWRRHKCLICETSWTTYEICASDFERLQDRSYVSTGAKNELLNIIRAHELDLNIMVRKINAIKTEEEVQADDD